MQPTTLETERGTIPALTHGPDDGELVVALHGFPDTPHTFAPLADALAGSGHRVVAPWIRGYHPDFAPAEPYADAGTLCADVLAVLDALSPDAPARVVGHDWGAIAVWGLAAAAPERLARPVALAVPPPSVAGAALFTRPDQLQRSFYMLAFQVEGVGEAVVAPDSGLIDYLWAQWSPGLAAIPHHDEVAALFADPVRAAATLKPYRAFFDPGLADPAQAELAAATSGPARVGVLGLGGADDGCLAPDIQASAADVAGPGGTVEVWDDCGHFLHLERPVEVARRLVTWWRS